MKWWVYVNGEVKENSFSREELTGLPAFDPDLHVMRTTDDEWTRAGNDPKLAPLFDARRTGTSSRDQNTGTEAPEEATEWNVFFGSGQPEGPFTLNELLELSSLEATTPVQRKGSNDWKRAIQDPKLKPHFSFEPVFDRDGLTGWFTSIPGFLRDVFWSTSDFYSSLDPRTSVLYSFFFGAFGLGLFASVLFFNQNLLLASSLNEIIKTLGLYSILSPAYIIAGFIPALLGLLAYTALFEMTARLFCSIFDWSKESWTATAKIVSYGHGAVATYFGIFSTIFAGLMVVGKLTLSSVGLKASFLSPGLFGSFFYGLLAIGIILSTYMSYVGFRKLHHLSSRQAMAVVILPPIVTLGVSFTLASYVTLNAF